ncbi:MAG: energy transducer TonB [Gammaproteobacteria bacterium]|nr:energy transducer TonB [Gammaproteobacteria bacterium]
MKRIPIFLVLLGLAGCVGFDAPDSYPSGVIPGTEFATEPFRVADDADTYDTNRVRNFEITADLSTVRSLEKCLPGTVIVEFMVAPDGQPVNIRILDSQPPGAYDHSAFMALQKSRFEPTIVDGMWQPEVQQRPITFDVPSGCE